MHLSTPNGTLAYDSIGTGPLILLLPGLGDLRQSYRFLQPHLAEQGYRVVSMDLRGHGESSSHWPEYTTQATAEDLLRLIQHLDAGPALVIGILQHWNYRVGSNPVSRSSRWPCHAWPFCTGSATQPAAKNRFTAAIEWPVENLGLGELTSQPVYQPSSCRPAGIQPAPAPKSAATRSLCRRPRHDPAQRCSRDRTPAASHATGIDPDG